jgi:NAD(P)-dependent dehydrogenase (short-subunit alcohol dehydrogenase family)
MPPTTGPILITGCSSGIGRATALRLAQAGHIVYASARRPETLDELARAGASTLALDVTDEHAMTAAVQTVERVHGSVGVLINNAGYGEYGPVEEVSLRRVRQQFETNVFGLARMIQLVLPGMRAASRGRIVNVSSMGGRITLPLGGFYHASKWAVEALSEALRIEVAPFGIQVSVIEPGPIRSEFLATTARTLTSESDAATGPYAKLKQTFVRLGESRLNATFESRPQAVAAAIERAVTAPRPKPRYVVTATARGLIFAHGVLPTQAWASLSRRLIGG